MNNRGIIFDLDDTLYREHDYVLSGFRAVSREISKYTTTTENVVYKMLVKEWQENGRGKVFDRICVNLGIVIDIQNLVSIYRNHKPKLSLYSDAIAVIKKLSKQQTKLGIITDGNSQMQWLKIKSLDLEKWFDNIIVTGDLGQAYWKPHELPYKLIVDKFGISYRDCVYVGDNPNKDFITAKRLGMRTIRIIRQVGDHMKTQVLPDYDADKTIYTLYDLIED